MQGLYKYLHSIAQLSCRTERFICYKQVKFNVINHIVDGALQNTYSSQFYPGWCLCSSRLGLWLADKGIIRCMVSKAHSLMSQC